METESLSRSEARIAKRQQMAAYVKARAQGENCRAAALEAGFSVAKADKATRDIEPKVQKRISEYLEQHGAGNEEVARVVGEAMNASRESKYGSQPDHFIRLKAAQFQAELTGQVKRDINVGVGVQINLPQGMAERFMQWQQARTVDAEAGDAANGVGSAGD